MVPVSRRRSYLPIRDTVASRLVCSSLIARWWFLSKSKSLRVSWNGWRTAKGLEGSWIVPLETIGSNSPKGATSCLLIYPLFKGSSWSLENWWVLLFSSFGAQLVVYLVSVLYLCFMFLGFLFFVSHFYNRFPVVYQLNLICRLRTFLSHGPSWSATVKYFVARLMTKCEPLFNSVKGVLHFRLLSRLYVNISFLN